MEYFRDEDGGTLVVDGGSVALPFDFGYPTVFGDVLVCYLSTDSPAPHEPDFDLPDEDRNLVGIDAEGHHRWTVENDPQQEPGDHYVRVYSFHDRCVCKRATADGDDRWVEVDPETGSIRETFLLDEFRIDGGLTTFEDEISTFDTFGDVALISESGEHGFREAYVSAYDASETRLWRRKFTSAWLLERDGAVVSMHEPRMGCNSYVEHDLRTGEPVAIHGSVFETRPELERWLPGEFHHLIDDYLDDRETE